MTLKASRVNYHFVTYSGKKPKILTKANLFTIVLDIVLLELDILAISHIWNVLRYWQSVELPFSKFSVLFSRKICFKYLVVILLETTISLPFK